jgi:hypothetical protein
MKRSETAALLTKIAAYDRRTIGEADIEAWTEALDGLVTLQDSLVAVRNHFRESSEWLMPKEIIDRARKLRQDRLRTAGYPDLPQGLTQAQEREWVRYWQDHLQPEPVEQFGGIYQPRPDPIEAQRLTDKHFGINRIESPADPERVKAIIAQLARELPAVKS